MKKIYFSLIVLILIFTAFVSNAEIPGVISYQGRIVTSNGVPADGAYEMAFRIYDVQTGGTQYFAEMSNIVLHNGFFNVDIGLLSSLKFMDFSKTYWLEVQFGANPPYPRTLIATVPYAFYSDRSGFADSSLVSGTVKKIDLNKTELIGRIDSQNLPVNMNNTDSPEHYTGDVTFDGNVFIKGNLQVGTPDNNKSGDLSMSSGSPANNATDFPKGIMMPFTDPATQDGWEYTGIKEERTINDSANANTGKITFYWFLKK